MKVLFLDIDGVLNDGLGAVIQPDRVALVNSILDETNANVVISSSWGHVHGVVRVSKMLVEQGFAGEIIGGTTKGATRGEEIAAYLADHPEIENFVALDDSVFMHPVSANWVKTSGRRGGITQEEALAAIEILKGTKSDN